MSLLYSTSAADKVKNLDLPGFPVTHCHSVELGMIAEYNESTEKLTAIGSIFRQGFEWVHPQFHSTSIKSKEAEYSFDSTTEKSNSASFVAAAVSMVTLCLTRTGGYQFQGRLSFTAFERDYEVIEALQNNFDAEVNAGTEYAENMKKVLKSNMGKNIVVVIGYYQDAFSPQKIAPPALALDWASLTSHSIRWEPLRQPSGPRIKSHITTKSHLYVWSSSVQVLKTLPSSGCPHSG